MKLLIESASSKVQGQILHLPLWCATCWHGSSKGTWLPECHVKTVYCQNSYICITWKGRDVYLKQLPKKSNIQTWLTSLFAVTAKIKYWNVIDKFTINLSSNFKVKFQDQKSDFYIGCSFRFWVLSHALTCWWWSSLSLTFKKEQIFLNFHSQRTFDLKWALYDWSPAYKEKWKHESHIYHIYDISNTD